MNPISKIMVNFMKQKLPFSYGKSDNAKFTKVLFSTCLFYFMFNSKNFI